MYHSLIASISYFSSIFIEYEYVACQYGQFWIVFGFIRICVFFVEFRKQKRLVVQFIEFFFVCPNELIFEFD